MPNDDVPTWKNANYPDPNKALAGKIYQTASDVIIGDNPARFPLPCVKPGVVRAKMKWEVYGHVLVLPQKRYGGPWKSQTPEQVVATLVETLRELVKKHGPLEVGVVAMDIGTVKVFAWSYPNEEEA